MRKINLIILTTVAVVLALILAMPGITSVSAAPEVKRVGLVTAYVPGDSITIVDKDGNQYMFELGSPLKILPPDRTNDLAVGAYVTIIAPNNILNGKHIAIGVVIHPGIPAGFPVPTATFTSVPTDTMLPTETSLPTETPATVESPTEETTATETPTGEETPTDSVTPTGTLTVESPTPTETPAVTTLSPDGARSSMTAFMEWLAMLFRQIVSS